MKCPNCQAEIADSAKFCPECGAKTDQKKICSNCGVELSPNAKFCPECGTPCNQTVVQQSNEEQKKDIFWITQNDLDSAIGDELRLVSIDSIDSTRDIVEVGIDDDGDAGIMAKKTGKVQVIIGFTYRELKNRKHFSATMVCNFIIKKDNEIELEDYQFENTNDEEGETANDTWNKVGSIATKAASFIGAVGLGILQGMAAANDNDDDY